MGSTQGRGVLPVLCSLHFNLLFRAELDPLFLSRQAGVSPGGPGSALGPPQEQVTPTPCLGAPTSRAQSALSKAAQSVCPRRVQGCAGGLAHLRSRQEAARARHGKFWKTVG